MTLPFSPGKSDGFQVVLPLREVGMMHVNKWPRALLNEGTAGAGTWQVNHRAQELWAQGAGLGTVQDSLQEPVRKSFVSGCRAQMPALDRGSLQVFLEEECDLIYALE